MINVLGQEIEFSLFFSIYFPVISTTRATENNLYDHLRHYSSSWLRTGTLCLIFKLSSLRIKFITVTFRNCTLNVFCSKGMDVRAQNAFRLHSIRVFFVYICLSAGSNVLLNPSQKREEDG